MTFGQKNYPQKLGNGNFTISEAGCMVTMFSNSLQVINGSGPDPVTLNQFFLEHGFFIKDSDGALEDLAWNSITHYDPTITVSSVGGAGVPPSNLAGVEFHYNGVHTGQPIDHFCWVSHIDNGQIYIIDSWDGIVKSPAEYESTYHKPIAYATYVKAVPAPAVVVPAPPAAPVTAGNSADTYNVVIAIPGYVHASDAATSKSSNSEVPVGQYYVFNRDGGMVNVTRILGQPGWWINPANNVVPVKPSLPPFTVDNVTPVPVEAPTLPIPAEPEAPTDWRITYVPLNPQRTTVYYLALQTITVHDLAENNKDLPLKQYEIVPVEGTFINNGVVYARTASSVKNNKWYGIPMTNLSLESDIYNSTTTPLERIAIGNTNTRDKFLRIFHDIGKILDKLSVSKITKK